MDTQRLQQIDPVVWIVLGVVLLAILLVVVVRSRRAAARRDRLRERFGSEYDRTVDATSRKRAADDLEDRLARRDRIDPRPLDDGSASELRSQLDDLQAIFVDQPDEAVRAARELVSRLAAARGYADGPSGDGLDLVSVDHPELVADHRRAQHDLEGARERTENDRRAFLASRALAERLLADGGGSTTDPTIDAPFERLPDASPPADSPHASNGHVQRADVPGGPGDASVEDRTTTELTVPPVDADALEPDPGDRGHDRGGQQPGVSGSSALDDGGARSEPRRQGEEPGGATRRHGTDERSD